MPHHDYPEEVEQAAVGRGCASLWAMILLYLLTLTALLLLSYCGII